MAVVSSILTSTVNSIITSAIIMAFTIFQDQHDANIK